MNVIYEFDVSEEIDSEIKNVVDEKIKDLQDHDRDGVFSVVLHNDPINNLDYVIEVIEKVFGYGTAKALWLTLKAHFSGKSKLWLGDYKKAKNKANKVIAHGPDPRCIDKGAMPLTVTVEKEG